MRMNRQSKITRFKYSICHIGKKEEKPKQTNKVTMRDSLELDSYIRFVTSFVYCLHIFRRSYLNLVLN